MKLIIFEVRGEKVGGQNFGNRNSQVIQEGSVWRVQLFKAALTLTFTFNSTFNSTCFHLYLLNRVSTRTRLLLIQANELSTSSLLSSLPTTTPPLPPAVKTATPCNYANPRQVLTFNLQPAFCHELPTHRRPPGLFPAIALPPPPQIFETYNQQIFREVIHQYLPNHGKRPRPS